MVKILFILSLIIIFFSAIYPFIKPFWVKYCLEKTKKKKREMLKISMEHAISDYIRKKAKYDALSAKLNSINDKLVEKENQLLELIKKINYYENKLDVESNIIEDLKKKGHDLNVNIENTKRKIEEITKEMAEFEKFLTKAREISESESEKYYEETGERNSVFWWNSDLYDSEYIKTLYSDLLKRKPKK